MDFDPDNSIAAHAAQMARLFSKRLGDAIRPLGIAPGQFPVLLELWKRDGQSQKALVDALGVEQATIANTLARMERDGLITREPDKKDQRSRRIYLSPKARDLQGSAIKASAQVNALAGKGLYSSEQERFATLMKKVIGNLTGEV